MKNKKAISLIIKWFMQGLLLVTPISITIYILYFFFSIIDSSITSFMNNIIGWSLPGIGIIAIIILITLIGILGSTIIFKPAITYIDKLIGQAPLIKLIYGAIKDFMNAFVGKEKRFTEPVLVKINKLSDIEKLGFVTQKDLTNIGISKNKIAVYLPHSYNFSGNLFIVPVENITPINAPSSEIMKFIVTAGITSIDLKEKQNEKKTTDISN